MFRFLSFVLIGLIVIRNSLAISNPYVTLGVSQSATTQEIKKAYKSLVKEWHPDKNPAPNAQQKFVEISTAYKLLSDSEKREYFDNTGRTESEPTYSSFKNFHNFMPEGHFDNIFGFSHLNRKAEQYYQRQSINMRSYESKILPASEKKAYVILSYTSQCTPCSRLLPIWQRLSEELVPSNIGVQTVHASEDELLKKLGVNTVPYVVLVLDGHPYHYSQATISMSSLFEFTKNKFPSDIVQKVTEHNLKDFLSGWIDNKVRILLFGRLDIIRMRYLSLAWEFRNHAVVGYVQMGLVETESIRSRYGVSSKGDTLLVFLEDDSMPVSSISMVDLPYDSMKAIIDANKYLILPRLSNQETFDALCPIEAVYSRCHLCAVLITENSREHDEHRLALRKFALNQKSHRLTYTYIFKEKQRKLVQALVAGVQSPESLDLNIFVIWRKDKNHIQYEWVEEKWSADSDFNKSSDSLRQVIDKLLHTDEPMSFEAEIQELYDENTLGLFWRLVKRLQRIHRYLQDKISSEDLIAASSVIATIIFIVFAGYFMSYLVQLEEQKIRERGDHVNLDPKSKSDSPQMKVHELRAESYFGLVRFLKPGCRTLVLLCDNESKVGLLKKFHKACWPYRKNRTLMFAFLNIERSSSMQWYKQILSMGLVGTRELSINPKNTVGTVLSLNGHRKYYCIYHAKHPEDPRTNGMDDSSMDLNDSDSDGTSDLESGNHRKDSVSSQKPLLDSNNVLLEDQLLEGFFIWLDRLFEGSTRRYHLNFWPDWPGK